MWISSSGQQKVKTLPSNYWDRSFVFTWKPLSLKTHIFQRKYLSHLGPVSQTTPGVGLNQTSKPGLFKCLAWAQLAFVLVSPRLCSPGASCKPDSLQSGCLDVCPFLNRHWRWDFFGPFVPPLNKLLSKVEKDSGTGPLLYRESDVTPALELGAGEHLTWQRLTAVTVFGRQQHVKQHW